MTYNLFADDTCVYLNNKNLVALHSNLNLELLKVGTWIESNCLSLNVNKTVYILFHGKMPIDETLSLYIQDKKISRNSETKFLGLIIDQHLSWKSHAMSVHAKVSRMLGVVSKLRDFHTPTAIMSIYYSLIFQHINYGIIFLGAVS